MVSLPYNIQKWSQNLCPYYKNYDVAYHTVLILLEHVLGLSRHELMLLKDIDEHSVQEVDFLVHRIINEHIPLAYLVGTVYFLNFKLIIKPPVLIPRPETEQWCSEMLSRFKNEGEYFKRILDIGTGSGCLAIACARTWSHVEVDALDIDSSALALAQLNAHSYPNIHIKKSDLFENVQGRYDLIVTNPPYVSEEEYTTLDASVVRWESSRALVSLDNGYNHIKKIVSESTSFLTAGGWLWCEVGASQADNVVLFFKAAGFSSIGIIYDYAGIKRVIFGQYL